MAALWLLGLSGMANFSKTKYMNPLGPDESPLSVCFFLQEGVEILDFAGPMEVFAKAGFTVFTVSKSNEPVISQGILKLVADYTIENAPPSDVLAVFGGNGVATSKDRTVIEWIKTRRQHTRYFFSVCTGAFLFGEAGILDGLTATTFHLSIDALSKTFSKTRVLAGKRFVDNGNVITTAGISAGIDGALHLVSKLRGQEEAWRIAKYIEYDKWVPDDGLIIK